MIVQRVTAFFKVGKMEEAVALILAEVKRHKPPHGFRIYTPDLGVAHDKACTEWEFENMSEREAYWSKWVGTPDAQAFYEKYQPLLEPGEMTEIWNLAQE